MATRVSADVDMMILTDLSNGIANKTIAKKYGVSTSYVSKLKTGRKTPYIYIDRPAIIKEEMCDIVNGDLTEIIAFINSKELFVDSSAIISYIESQMRKAVIQAKMYQEILRRLKNGN